METFVSDQAKEQFRIRATILSCSKVVVEEAKAADPSLVWSIPPFKLRAADLGNAEDGAITPELFEAFLLAMLVSAPGYQAPTLSNRCRYVNTQVSGQMLRVKVNGVVCSPPERAARWFPQVSPMHFRPLNLANASYGLG